MAIATLARYSGMPRLGTHKAYARSFVLEDAQGAVMIEPRSGASRRKSDVLNV